MHDLDRELLVDEYVRVAPIDDNRVDPAEVEDILRCRYPLALLP